MERITKPPSCSHDQTVSPSPYLRLTPLPRHALVVDAVVDEHSRSPHQEGTEGLEQVADHRVGVLHVSATPHAHQRHAHRAEVEHQQHHHGENVQDEDRHAVLATAHLLRQRLPQIQAVDEVLVQTASLLSGQHSGDGQRDEGGEHEAPHALHTHDHVGGRLDALQQVLLDDGLESLNALRHEHQRHAENHLAGGDGLAGVLLGGQQLATGEAEEARLRDADDHEGQEDDAKRDPLGCLQRLLQPELANQTGEDDNGATNHLPDGDIDPEEADEHDERGEEVAESGSEHLVVHGLDGALVLRVPTITGGRRDYHATAACSGFFLIFLSILQALIYPSTAERASHLKGDEQERHAKEHDEVGEPGLLEVLFLAVSTNRLGLVTISMRNRPESYRSLPKINEQVPDTRNRVIQRIRTPMGVFFFSTVLASASDILF